MDCVKETQQPLIPLVSKSQWERTTREAMGSNDDGPSKRLPAVVFLLLLKIANQLPLMDSMARIISLL